MIFWCLFCGIVLPISFSAQIPRTGEVLSLMQMTQLYGTEYLIFFVLSLLFSSIVAVLRRAVPTGLVRWVNGAEKLIVDGVVASILVMGTVIWLRALGVQILGDSSRFILWTALTALVFNRLVETRPIVRRARLLGITGALSVVVLLCVAGIGLLRSSPAAPPASSRTSQGPNIVLITVDSLSADHLIGSGPFAREGMSFEFAGSVNYTRAYAPSNFTTGSIVSLMTGVYPDRHGAYHLSSSIPENLKQQTLPLGLQKLGYHTVAVVGNAWAGPKRLGIGEQFDTVLDVHSLRDNCRDERMAPWYLCQASMNLWLAQFKRLARLVAFRADLSNSTLTEKTIHSVEQLSFPPSKGNFLWIHLLSPHEPYAAKAPWLGHYDSSSRARSMNGSSPPSMFSAALAPTHEIETLAARYDEGVLELKSQLERLVVVAQHQLPDAEIFITADHGESFHHGYGSHTGPMLYSELVHVPLVHILSSKSKDGSHRTDCSEPVSLLDVAPTILELAGGVVPESWEGRALGHCGAKPAKAVYSMNFEQSRDLLLPTQGSVSLISDRYHWVQHFGHMQYPNLTKTLGPELYDVVKDPAESVNLAIEDPRAYRKLTEELRLAIPGSRISLFDGALSGT